MYQPPLGKVHGSNCSGENQMPRRNRADPWLDEWSSMGSLQGLG